MIIDNDAVISGMVRSVRSQIGYLLSDLPSQDPQNPIKAVIKDIQGGIRPDYPFITITLEQNQKQIDAWQRAVVAGSDDKAHYISEQVIPVRITCYGESASSILTVLRSMVVDDTIRSAMNEDTGTIFQNYTDIIREPIYLSTDFVNTARITATLTAVSDLALDSSGIIERVTGEGRYLRYEGDDNPIVEPIDTSS